MNLSATLQSWSHTLKGLVLEASRLDLRSLGIFRILFGLNIIYELAVRLQNLEDFYGEKGVIQAELARHYWRAKTRLPSIFFLSPDTNYHLALLCAALLMAVLFTCGVWTRPMGLALAYFVASFEIRFPLITIGNEGYFTWFLLCAAVLPVDRFFSLTSYFGKEAQMSKDTDVQSLSSICFLLLLGLSYYLAGMSKLLSPHWLDGTALLRTFQPNIFSTEFAYWLTKFPVACRTLSYSIPIFESAIPLLIWFPLGAGTRRSIFAFAMIAMHGMFALALHVGDISTVCISLWVATLPSSFWTIFRLKTFSPGTTRLPIAQRLLSMFILVISLGSYFKMTCDVFARHETFFKWKTLGQMGLDHHWRKHFSAVVKSSAWIQVIGSKDSAKFYEVSLPFHAVSESIRQSWPTDIYHDLCSTRIWQKTFVEAQTRNRPFILQGLRVHLCNRYGPSSKIELSKFFIFSHSRPIVYPERETKITRTLLDSFTCN